MSHASNPVEHDRVVREPPGAVQDLAWGKALALAESHVVVGRRERCGEMKLVVDGSSPSCCPLARLPISNTQPASGSPSTYPKWHRLARALAWSTSQAPPAKLHGDVAFHPGTGMRCRSSFHMGKTNSATAQGFCR
jgi:hypothetical protein